MKYLIVLFLAMSAMANYVPESKIGSGENLTVFMKSVKCVSHYNEKCIKLPIGYNASFHILQDEMVDDLTKPIWDKIDISNCTDQADCDAQHVELLCSQENYEKIKNYDLLQVYCVKIVGYEPKSSGRKMIAVDNMKKSNYETQKEIKSSSEKLISSKIKDMDFGRRIYAIVQVTNRGKGLSKAQRRLLRKDLKEIRDDLFDGNICEARTDINALTVDGVIIKSSDISAVNSVIDSYKTCI